MISVKAVPVVPKAVEADELPLCEPAHKGVHAKISAFLKSKEVWEADSEDDRAFRLKATDYPGCT